MANFYMLLDSDVNISNRRLMRRSQALKLLKSAPASGNPEASKHSYAYLLCDGFQKYNVQGEYAVPFKGGIDLPEGKLKLRDAARTTRKRRKAN